MTVALSNSLAVLRCRPIFVVKGHGVWCVLLSPGYESLLIASLGSSTPSSVDFPLSESPQRSSKPGTPLRAPHLPFRRISLPTAPSILHRISVVSIASFDSFPEDGDESPQSSRTREKAFGKSRPISIESPRRRKRTRDTSVKPDDDRHASRRRKIVDEFYETEKAYVDGLELIYSVSMSSDHNYGACADDHSEAFSDSHYYLSRHIRASVKSFGINFYFLKLHRHLEFASVISFFSDFALGSS